MQTTLQGQAGTVVRLCGPLVLEVDGARLESALPSRQGRLVFAYLVLNRERPVSRDELIDALWPGRAPASPQSLLTGLLSRLRRVLPAGVLEGRTQLSLRLQPDAWIDMEVAAGAPARAHGALASGDGSAAIATAREALEILERPLLPDLDRPWVDERRRELADLSLVLLELLARSGLAAGDLIAAQAAARRLIERERFRESAHALLMEVHAARGDVAEALRTYDALRTLLREELGTVPAAPLRALAERLLGDADSDATGLRRAIDGPLGARSAQPAATEQAEPSSPALPAPLTRTAAPIGRDAALARLEAVWAGAASGAMSVAVLAGEPGIGKTTLIAELARRLHERGAAVLYGRCEPEALVPYQPWVEALERHLRWLPPAERELALSSQGGALGRLLPGRGAAVERDPVAAERYVAFEAVRTLVERSAAARGLLLVLDDLHWVDSGSLQLLRHVTRLAGGARVLVAACVRDDELGHESATALAALRRQCPLVRLTLSGLDEEAVGELLASRTGTPDPVMARWLLERTAGNPFFVDELLCDRQERGDGASGPPPGVREVLSRRIARLDPAAQEALALAAVVGPRFDVGVLAAATARDVGVALQALDEAVAAGLLVDGGQIGRYAFAHALIVDTLLAGLPKSRRASLHLRVADAVEADETLKAQMPAGQIAWHLRAAGPLAGRERHLAWEVAAAREAARALAYEEAARHYEAALAAPPAAGAAFDRAELLLSLGHAHDRAGRREPARRAFLDAARLARERGDPLLLARAALGHGGLAVVIGTPDPTVAALLEEALTELPDDERATRARLRARLAVEVCYADPPRAKELSRQAVTGARAASDAAALATALNARRVALWSPAHLDERLDAAEAMVTAAKAAGDRESVLQGHNWRVVDLMELGRFDAVAAAIDEYDVLAGAVGLPHYRWYAPLWRACLAQLAGRWTDSVALTEQALALGLEADDPNAPLLVRLQSLHALVHQRRFSDIDRAWIAERAADPLAGVAWMAGLALLDAELGDLDAARRVISRLTRDRCVAVPTNANWHVACLLSEAAVRVADPAAAAALYELLVPYARLFPVVARGISCYGSTEYFLGRLAATLGRLDEAEARLRRATTENDRAGAAPHAALALVSLGEVLAARAKHAEARDAMAEAAARAHALHLRAVAAQAHHSLDGARPL